MNTALRLILPLFWIKVKNTLRDRHNLALLAVLPAAAAVCAWALLAFYIEGGASLPVGVLDLDRSAFSEIVTERFAQNESVDVRLLAADESGSVSGATAGGRPGETGETGETNDAVGAAASTAGDLSGVVRLVQTRSLEAVVVILPGFSDQLRRSKTNGLIDVICAPTGITRGFVAELFIAQVSRLSFNCDAANRVAAERDAAAKADGGPGLSDAERTAVWDEAFAFSDAYWEPRPLMTIEYERWVAAPPDPQAGAATSPADNTSQPVAAQPEVVAAPPVAADERPSAPNDAQGLRGLLNALVARLLFALFFAYAVYCVMAAAGGALAERDDGVLMRLSVCGFGARVWFFVSAAVPFLRYGVPCAALLLAVFRAPGRAAFAAAGFLGCALLGVFLASRGGQARYRLCTLACVAVAAAAALFFS
ncbi:MAG: hypothetical protein LBU58_07975 [Clostridiales bacterium]|jgi:hypothetical protein|nr:hypothetical protein [Clostridiales bacterium]